MRNYCVTVSDIALCQRCPALFAYKIHKRKKSAWQIGINGKGEAYGSIFHKNIAEVFFEAASNPNHRLHKKIQNAISGGSVQLEKIIRENIFMPFIEKNSENFSSGQILSMADGIKVWGKAMYNFFSSIPSLINNPEKNMSTVFIKPEGILEGNYNFNDGVLIVKGRYDALMFNPDKVEARLFEFKGFKKSDVTVPLSQSLIYSWLIAKSSGIVPSIEIIYLDDDKNSPDIFDSDTVRNMIKSGLPRLFYSVFNIISLRRFPEILKNKNLCTQCKFRFNCENDIKKMFGIYKRRGSSLVSVLVFFLAAILITAQAFFFSTNSNYSLAEDRKLMEIKLQLAQCIENIKEDIRTNESAFNITAKPVVNTCDDFYKNTRKIKSNGGHYISNDIFVADVYDLDYDFQISSYSDTDTDKKIFPAMGEDYYLIRAFTKINIPVYLDDNVKKVTSVEQTLMYQVLVQRINSSDIPKTISYEEIWF